MVPRASARHLPLAVTGLLVLLLAALAALQWRWIGEVSEAERQRMRARLLASGTRFVEDFDREVTRVFFYFHQDPLEPHGERLERVAQRHARWLAEAPHPDLVRDVFHARRTDEGGIALQCLRPAAGRFEPCPWPPAMESVRRRLLGPGHAHEPAHGILRIVVPIAAELPGLVIPFPLQRRLRPDPGPPPGGGTEYLIVRLDEEVIRRKILPDLTQQAFGGAEGLDYDLAVVDGGDPGRTIYQSDARVPAGSLRTADLRLPLFALRPVEELHSLWLGGLRRRSAGRHMAHFVAPALGVRKREAGGWQLLVRHREGSLERAVIAVRHRNLMVSLGILTLLAATMGLMVAATQRAQRLARQQIEFVAGVTHELNTPLTAMRSAGQNLADGVVTEPGQVKRYGALIESEGRRLSNLVGQALELAGIQSGRRVYHPRPVAVDEIVDGALEDCRWLLAEKGIAVEKDLAAGLPQALADPIAVRRAVQNLVENAVKYGGRERWIGVRARAGGGNEVEITVTDRGPGIRREDLPHLFEPFYRGREAAAGGIPGSGLGLSLVRHVADAHRGRISVAAGTSGQGSAFTLHLPAVKEAGEAQPVEEPA